MRVLKLNHEQYKRSLKATMNHLWLYHKSETTQRTHNNSISLIRTNGYPFACLVIEYDSQLDTIDIENAFGKDVFIDGAVSPDDKDNMQVDVFYIKN
jgi:hypothetical protein